MPYAVPMQTNFTGGEIAPSLKARVDFPKYNYACQSLENFLVKAQGAAPRRSGFECLGRTKASETGADQAAILTPFIYANGDAYVLELGAGYIRFYKDGVLVPRPNSPENAFELAAPYTETDLPDLRFCQSADVLYITHPAHAPAMLCRHSNDDWTLTDIPFTGGPYRSENTTHHTVQADNTTGAVVLSAEQRVQNGDFGEDWNTDWNFNPISPPSGYTWVEPGQLTIMGRPHVSISQTINVRPGKTYTFSCGLENLSGVNSFTITISNTSLSGGITVTDTGVTSIEQEVTVDDNAETALVTLCATGSDWIISKVTFGNPLFTPNHAGALWKIGQREYDEAQVEAFTAPGNGDYLLVENQTFLAQLEGEWTGTMVLEKSWDLNNYTQFSAFSENVAVELPEEDAVYYRWRCESLNAGGQVTASLKVIRAIPKGEVRIDTYVDPFTVEATVLATLPATDPTPVWWEGAWSDHRGFPSLACFFDDRLMLAQNTTVFGSQPSDYYNFSVSSSALDSDAIQFTLLSRKLNSIAWMEPSRRLLLGTWGGEWWMSGADDRDAITPGNALARQESFYGSGGVPPVRVANSIVFVQKHGKTLFDLSYSLNQDGYLATDLSILANHLTRNSAIRALAYQQYPGSILWACRQDGVLLGLTYQRQHDVAAWHHHTTQGEFESICVIPGEDRDELWAIVKRRINGAVRRFVERMAPDFPDNHHAANARFLDCHVHASAWNTDPAAFLQITAQSGGYSAGATCILTPTDYAPFSTASVNARYRLAENPSGPWCDVRVLSYKAPETEPVTATPVLTVELLADLPPGLQNTPTAVWAALASVIPGLDHLNGAQVDILADGSPQAPQTVTGGTITLDPPAATVCAGLPYASQLHTVNPEAGAANGTAQGRTKRITRATLRLHQSLGGQYGPDQDHLWDIPSLQLGVSQYGVPFPVVTGDITVDWPGGFETDGTILIRQEQPLPMTVLGFVLHLETFER